MEKLSKTEFYICLLITSMMLGGFGCGRPKKSQGAQDQTEGPSKEPQNMTQDSETEKDEPTQKSTEPKKDSPTQEASRPQVKSQEPAPSQPANPIEGTYLQVENRQARVVIAPGLLLTTNLEFPSPAGNGTRLTPSFPQGLRYISSQGEYRTIGTYNDGTGVFKNIEIRVRLYNQSKYLDVTLITSPLLSETYPEGEVKEQSEGSRSGSATSGLNSTEGLNVRTFVVSFCPPVVGLPSCPPPPPPPPPTLPHPCPNPCPPRDQMIYVYRFERA